MTKINNSQNAKTILSDFDDDFEEFETPSQKILRELKEKREKEEKTPVETVDSDSEDEIDYLADSESEAVEETNNNIVDSVDDFIKDGKLMKNSLIEWTHRQEELKKDYENYFDNGVLSGEVKEQFEKLKDDFKCSDEQIKKTFNKRYDDVLKYLENVNEIENRPCFTFSNTSFVAVPTYDYKAVGNVKYYCLQFDKLGIYPYERIIYKFVRPYFDIDFKEFTFDDLKEVLNFLNELSTFYKTYNPEFKFVGVAEYRPTAFNDKGEAMIVKMLNDFGGLLTFKNEVENFTKVCSIHIYGCGVCLEAKENKDFMDDKLKEYEQTHGRKLPGLDCSVYKNSGKQQIFRPPYSGKGGDDEHKRVANPNMMEYMKDKDNKQYIVENCVAFAYEGDYVIRYTKQSTGHSKEEETRSNNKQTIEVKTEDGEVKLIDGNDNSIFRYLSIGGKVQDVLMYAKDMNHWDFIGKFYYLFEGLALSEKQFYKELELVKPNLNISKTKSKTHYKQNFKEGYEKLIIIRANVIKHINELEKNKELTVLQQKELERCEKIVYSIDDYLLKYEKQNFIEHDFYDIKNLENTQNKRVSKFERIIYNCFKTENDEAVYYLKNGRITSYKCKEALRRAFKMSGECVNKVFDKLVSFESVNEFVCMRLQKRYDDLPDNEKSVDDLIKMIKESFTNEDDFKYYLSWLAYKVRYKTTNDRSIVCQSEDGPGQDSLKTFITQKLAPFIEVKTADVRNLNKNLNGSYLTGHLTVIEELPPRIKDTGDFISVLKTYSKNKTFLIEEKKEKPREIENRTDFIINTNYNVAYLFYNKADANPLSKRIRILTRKSIDTKKWCKTLDKYGRDDIDDFNGFKFYKYLYNNEELIKYFVKHRLDKSETEKLYISAATTDTNDKIETNYDENDFVEWFKNRFINKDKRLKLGKFVDYLKDKEIFKGIKQATLKQQLITSKCMHVENGYNILSDEEIKNVYKKYFVYEEVEGKQSLNDVKKDVVDEDE